VYEGKLVGGSTILRNELSCLAVDDGPNRCYDSPMALRRAETAAAVVKASRRKSRRARASACGINEILIIWVSADYSGASAAFADRHRWARISSRYRN
jgi:hypothetical protein